MYTLVLLFSLYNVHGGVHLESLKIEGFETLELCRTEGRQAATDMDDKPGSPGYAQTRVKFSCIKQKPK